MPASGSAAQALPAEPWWAAVLRGLGSGTMDAVAYDTAWIARVRSTGGRALAFPSAWEWLGAHQRPDGAWGADVAFLPDRLAATAAAVVALAEGARDGVAQPRPGAVAAGLAALQRLCAQWSEASPDTETVGFELCLPALLAEARGLHLPVPAALPAVERRRQAKLARLPAGWRQHPPASLCHSLEGWAEGVVPDGLLDAFGSCGNSPSATAYHQRHRPSPAALRYLGRSLRGGGAVDVQPFEVFETAWALDHLALGGCDLHAPAFAPLLGLLRGALRPEGAAGISAVGLEPDADDTALALLTLARGGAAVSAEPLRAFERDGGFACFPFERDPSVSANVHVAYAVTRLPYAERLTALAKVLGFLAEVRRPEGCWTDKWHLSPYYPTGRAVLALRRVAPDLVAPAVRWLASTQRPDGGWGLQGSSPEETAYAVEALATARTADPAAMARAAAYLSGHDARPPLWIGKGLYCPRRVVDAAAAAALRIAGRWCR